MSFGHDGYSGYTEGYTKLSGEVTISAAEQKGEVCRNGLDDNNDGQVDENCNQPPIANAGPDLEGKTVGETVILYGGSSKDQDGDSLQYQWTKIKGPDTVN